VDSFGRIDTHPDDRAVDEGTEAMCEKILAPRIEEHMDSLLASKIDSPWLANHQITIASAVTTRTLQMLNILVRGRSQHGQREEQGYDRAPERRQ